jgi:arylsulfatase
LTELDANAWELYHIDEDFAENHNVADSNRAKLIEMIGQWYVEAGKYNVMPVDGRGQQRFAEERPTVARPRNQYTFYPGTQEVASSAAPRTLNRQHSVHARVVIPEGGAEGVLVSQGGIDGGFSFFIKDGKLTYVYNYVADRRFRIVSDTAVPAGEHILSFEFEPTGEPEPLKGKGAPGTIKLFVDGEQVGEGELPVTIPLLMGLSAGVSVGSDAGAPVVVDDYTAPFPFTGTLEKVMYDLSGDHVIDHEAEFRIALARQ